MAAKSKRPTDDEILRHVRNRDATYVVRNRIEYDGVYRDLKTSWVLRRLKRLERAGQVRRVPSLYAVMICWEQCDSPAIPAVPAQERVGV